MSVQLSGFREAIARNERIARRTADPAMALAPEMAVIEAEEAAIFAHWGGKYVHTGRAERSLTGASGDSIRLIHGAELEFGTAVEYVRYLTAEHEGRHHHGRNEVMISGFEVKEGEAGQRILQRIVGD